MKAVILGGGIAGLTMGLLLRKKTGMLLSARSKYGQPRTCILMSADGLSILSEFSKEQSSALHKQNQFIQFKRPDGDEETESN
jgi:2-polyprenyl-6-methoxyphenol hydroxylase-like FAD-dependent oxidoreductase